VDGGGEILTVVEGLFLGEDLEVRGALGAGVGSGGVHNSRGYE